MLFQNVSIASIGYEIAPLVVTSDALEERLAGVYERLRIPRGQLAALTGIRERRWWEPQHSLSASASRAGLKALQAGGLATGDIQAVVYAGVCRENLEPATACAVADRLGIGADAVVYDVSNACLGVLNGMLQVAGAIELGQMRAGLVVSCESARQIVELMMERLIREPTMERFKTTLATLTGGSGAIGVLLARRELAPRGAQLLGGVIRNAARHHGLCRWGPDTGIPASAPMVMETHAIDVLENGVRLGVDTWRAFREEMRQRDPAWSQGPQKVICHQVGATNRDAILNALGLSPQQDFSTFELLGNIGTVSLPITAAIAAERGFLQTGDRVGFLGIGSGLNCLMLGVQW